VTGVEAVTITTDRTGGLAERPSEATEVHTRILRLALGIEESRSYWEHIDPMVPVAERGARR
jgi:hypothetical protein